MKSKLFKTMVLASSLVFLNCGDESTTAPMNDVGGFAPSSSSEFVLPESSADVGGGSGTDVLGSSDSAQSGDVVPGSSTDVGSQMGSGSDESCLASSLPDACGPGTNPLPTSSADAVPASSANAPASSADVAAASSSATAPASSADTPASSAVAPASSSSDVSTSSATENNIFLAEGTDEDKDQMKVKFIERTLDNGGGILAYPEQLSTTKKHAVVLWGPGGGTEPGAYGGIINRLASHGFIVIATSESPDGTGRGKPALDWLAKKNNDPNDPLYQKIDMTKVGCSGHSMGGLQSEQMLINDDRVITAVMNNSGAFNHAELTKVSTSKSVAIVYGEGGMERPNAEGDYNNNNVKAPACLIKMTGGQGNECQNGECGWGHGSGPWGGMAATVAWMRWHLGGEDFRKKDFVGTSGKYIDGNINGQPGKWKGQCKNF